MNFVRQCVSRWTSLEEMSEGCWMCRTSNQANQTCCRRDEERDRGRLWWPGLNTPWETRQTDWPVALISSAKVTQGNTDRHQQGETLSTNKIQGPSKSLKMESVILIQYNLLQAKLKATMNKQSSKCMTSFQKHPIRAMHKLFLSEIWLC